MSPITAIQTSPSMSTASASANPKAQQLDRAAHQFEAMLLQEMLKPLGQHADISGENSDGGEGSSSPLESFGIEAIAGSLAHSNALGFAGRIESALLASGKNTTAQTPFTISS